MSTLRDRLRSMGVHAALFGVVGPLVGVLCFLALAVIEGPASRVAEALLFPRIFVVGAFLLFGAYVLGTIPAVATGIVFAAVSQGRRWNVRMSAAWGAGIGVAVTAIHHLIVEAWKQMPGAPPLTLLLIGAVSGGVCAALGSHLAPGAVDHCV